MPISKDKVIGKWSVYEMTQLFKGQDEADIDRTMDSLDSGKTKLEQLLGKESPVPVITVEILDSGRMFMTIVQPMRPDIPGAMNIRAQMDWDIEGDCMATQAVLDKLEAHVTLDTDLHLSDSQLAELKAQVPGIEAATLRNMKTEPVWTNRNMVTVVYCGERHFLTRSETGILMLHQRKGAADMSRVRFSHVGLSCKDQQAIERFYTRYFGFKRSRVIDFGSTEIIFLRNDEDVHLELFRADEERPVPRPVGDGPHYAELRHLAFQVDDVDEVLKAMGTDAEITLGPVGFDDFIKGWKTVWLKDPDGNIVEVSQGYKDDH